MGKNRVQRSAVRTVHNGGYRPAVIKVQSFFDISHGPVQCGEIGGEDTVPVKQITDNSY